MGYLEYIPLVSAVRVFKEIAELIFYGVEIGRASCRERV